MKRTMAWLLVLMLCVSLLAGCSKGKGDEPVSINGTWKYEGVINCAYIFNSDGTGAYQYEGTDMPFTYTDDGTSVSILFAGNTAPNVLKYSVEGKTLSIEDSFGSVMTYEKIKDGDTPVDIEPADPSAATQDPANTDTEPAAEPEETTESTEPVSAYDWWAGDWYGWWCIYNGGGTFAPLSDIAWDAYATIEVNEDMGHIRIWDSVLSEFGTLVNCNVLFEDGYGEHGAMVSIGGSFFDSGADWCSRDIYGVTAPIDEYQWNVDPANSTVWHFKDMLEIHGYYEDPGDPANCFEYMIYLRPWGMLWDDVRSGDTSECIYDDMMPIFYDDWYVPLMDMGITEMPATVSEGAQIINGGGSSEGAAGLGDKEGADGVVELEKLKSLLEWCKTETSYEMTYDEIAAKIGVHGKQIESLFDDCTIYRWLADDENYIQITFKLKDGQEYWNVTQWSGLK